MKEKKIYSWRFSTRGNGITSILRCGYLSFSTFIPSPKLFCPQRPICHWCIRWPLDRVETFVPRVPLTYTQRGSLNGLVGCFLWHWWSTEVLQITGTLSSLPLLFVPLSLHSGHNTSLHTCLCHEDGTAISKPLRTLKSNPVLSIYEPFPKTI